MKKEMVEWDDWGFSIPVDSLKDHQEDSEECQYCKERDEGRHFWQFIIGFIKDDSLESSLKVGFFFIQCPNCLAVFWRHAHSVEILEIHDFAREEQIFFKTPGAQEEFLEMIKRRKVD